MSTNSNSYNKELYLLNDPNNISSSKEVIYPKTTLDQVFDQSSATNKTLREILDDLSSEIYEEGLGSIIFPVTSVNNMTGDVNITALTIGLARVDNTADMDKPLSTPQKTSVIELISKYEPNIDMTVYDDHLFDTSNPHNVKFADINSSGEITNLISSMITTHNYGYDSYTHPDIRNSLTTLWELIDYINNNIDEKLDANIYNLVIHDDNMDAHNVLFSNCEKNANKSSSFSATVNNTHTNYPSNRAVMDYVADQINEFSQTLANVVDWINDIKIVNYENELPIPLYTNHRDAYIVKYHQSYENAIAVCRQSNDGQYYWDIASIGSITNFDETYFTKSLNGLTLNTDVIANDIISDGGLLEKNIDDRFSNYYDKTYIDDIGIVYAVAIVSGNTNGSIRYYTNNDFSTISGDVYIKGLNSLAYLSKVTETEIDSEAVHSDHLVNSCIDNRHLIDGSVTYDKISCNVGNIIGNLNNAGSGLCHEISMTELISAMSDNSNIEYTGDTNVEYDLGNGVYLMRFQGALTVLSADEHIQTLSTQIVYSRYLLLDSGGSYEYQSGTNKSIRTINDMSSSVYMDDSGVHFLSVSKNDRISSPYYIWIKYKKTA